MQWQCYRLDIWLGISGFHIDSLSKETLTFMLNNVLIRNILFYDLIDSMLSRSYGGDG